MPLIKHIYDNFCVKVSKSCREKSFEKLLNPGFQYKVFTLWKRVAPIKKCNKCFEIFFSVILTVVFFALSWKNTTFLIDDCGTFIDEKSMNMFQPLDVFVVNLLFTTRAKYLLNFSQIVLFPCKWTCWTRINN